MASTRRRNNSSRRADALLGYMIPLFFLLLASYQEVHDGQIDKYVIGALMVFGLGALGWRIDVLFEKYVEARAGVSSAKEDDHANDATDK